MMNLKVQCNLLIALIQYSYLSTNEWKIVTEFWKTTHMFVPETIIIFEFSMALLIADTNFKNISKLYL